jgi:signal transduction histidine kinase
MQQRGERQQPVKGRRANRPKPRTTAARSVADLRRQAAILTRELKEAREQQAATADILKVIASSPSNVQPVFEAIAERSNGLLDGLSTAVYSLVDDVQHLMAFTRTSPAADAALQSMFPRPLSAVIWGDAIRKGEVFRIGDAEVELVTQPSMRELARLRGWRSALLVPLLRGQKPIGTISVTRTEPGPFADHHVQLLETFADQAVIAIENARLFNETREALERQTATADVLKVIASSPSNLQPVFDTIAERSKALIGAHSTAVARYVDGKIELPSFTPVSPEADAVLGKMWAGAEPQAEQVLRGEIARITDAESEFQDPVMRDIARARGWRSRLFVPLKGDSGVAGWISATRREAGSFAEKDVDLLRTFADQAVIAIQNVELFEEVQAKTRDLEESLQQQTATADVLKVISRSTFDLPKVLDTLTESASRLCDAFDAVLLLREGDFLRIASHYGEIPVVDKWPVSRECISGRAVADRKPVHVHDLLAEQTEYSMAHAFARQTGHRTTFAVPLMRQDEAIGAISIRRMEVRPFTEKQIELMQTFADQAVIAIENARLLSELRMRTDELSQSLNDLRAAQDRLVQTEKLASLGQLTAGIAHEIKNPLNFVNNFSTLSAELTDELSDLLKSAALADDTRKDVQELTSLLKDNLGKVVQHGKRADSIVKNMLLHSREGSGERRSADVNALVGESLNLAYHGARAEKAGFSITLKHDLDPEAGALDLYPQEMTRALLNLISNGFYAATKRKVDAGDETFEPVLSAATRNLGKTVEIRIRDNGAGIPPEVREKMFNPFFTTKPTGEGTGLGLSMTHDIVVKQHGGRIDVETKLGQFTEFIITLPRDNRSAAGEEPE